MSIYESPDQKFLDGFLGYTYECLSVYSNQFVLSFGIGASITVISDDIVDMSGGDLALTMRNGGLSFGSVVSSVVHSANSIEIGLVGGGVIVVPLPGLDGYESVIYSINGRDLIV